MSNLDIATSVSVQSIGMDVGEEVEVVESVPTVHPRSYPIAPVKIS